MRCAAFGRSIVPAAAEGHEAAPFVAPVIRQWTWWQIGGLKFGIGIQIDGLSVALLFVVALHLARWCRSTRSSTCGATAATPTSSPPSRCSPPACSCMVIAENTVQLILGWEIMGLCSFMLIGHWWEDEPTPAPRSRRSSPCASATSACSSASSIMFFGANAWADEHLGSDGFNIFAISGWALSGDGQQDRPAVGARRAVHRLHRQVRPVPAAHLAARRHGRPDAGVVAAALLHHGRGRRLPRRPPVPGVLRGLQDRPDANVNLIALIGGITIIIAAVLAFVQVDIKKVLAYSTVSQLGYMMMGLGVGAWLPAVFHIFTHAFFKACLFLCAGSVSHSGSHHSFDMKKDMGGLWQEDADHVRDVRSSRTLALAGIFPLAGFWSKDEIIDNVGQQRLHGVHDHRPRRRLPHRGVHDPVRLPHLLRRAPRRRRPGSTHHGDEEHEIDDDRVLVDAGMVGAAVTAHELIDIPAEAAIAEGAPPDGHARPRRAVGRATTDHGEHTGRTSRNWLITVPLMILAVRRARRRLPQRARVRDSRSSWSGSSRPA